MEANQFRVGNIINECYSIVEIDSVSIGVVDMNSPDDLASYISLDIENIKPITLTEEWLLKLGAKNTAPFEYQLNILGEEYIISKYGSVNGSGKGYVIDYDFKVKRIKYVHEFQNRIFSLTGEELQIK